RLLPARDAGDLDLRQRLTMPLPLVVTGLALELVDTDLRSLDVPDQLRRDRGSGQLGRVGHQGVAVDEEHRRELDGVAGLPGRLLDLEHVALGDPVLLAAGLDDRVHGRGLLSERWSGGDAPRQATRRTARTGRRRTCAADKDTASARRGPNHALPARQPQARVRARSRPPSCRAISAWLPEYDSAHTARSVAAPPVSAPRN